MQRGNTLKEKNDNKCNSKKEKGGNAEPQGSITPFLNKQAAPRDSTALIGRSPLKMESLLNTPKQNKPMITMSPICKNPQSAFQEHLFLSNQHQKLQASNSSFNQITSMSADERNGSEKPNQGIESFQSPIKMNDNLYIRNPFSAIASPMQVPFEKKNASQFQAPYFSPNKIIHDYQHQTMMPYNDYDQIKIRTITNTPLQRLPGSRPGEEESDMNDGCIQASYMPEYPSFSARTNLLSQFESSVEGEDPQDIYHQYSSQKKKPRQHSRFHNQNQETHYIQNKIQININTQNFQVNFGERQVYINNINRARNKSHQTPQSGNRKKMETPHGYARNPDFSPILGGSPETLSSTPSAKPGTNSAQGTGCNCKKSKCLKLYCECFQKGAICNSTCNCVGCHNNENYEHERNEALVHKKEAGFQPQFSKIQNGQHVKGCNCKKSGCLKKYCECYQSGVQCAEHCKCEGCKNCDPSADQSLLESQLIDQIGVGAIKQDKEDILVQSPYFSRGKKQKVETSAKKNSPPVKTSITLRSSKRKKGII